MLFLIFLDNLLQDAYIIFQKDVDNFKIEHKTCSFWGRCSTPVRDASMETDLLKKSSFRCRGKPEDPQKTCGRKHELESK